MSDTNLYIDSGDGHWVITLDSYERANLLWLLGIIGYPCNDSSIFTQAVEPFHLVNNGDWVGQLVNKLEHSGYYGYTPHIPNMSVGVLQQQVYEWVKAQLKQMNGHDIAEILAESTGDKTNVK